MLFQWSKRLPRDISLKIVIIHKANIITVSQLEKCSSTGSLIWFYKLFNSTFYYALVINSYFVAHTVRCYAQCLSFVAHVRIKKYEYQNHAVYVLLVVCICLPYSTVISVCWNNNSPSVFDLFHYFKRIFFQACLVFHCLCSSDLLSKNYINK